MDAYSSAGAARDNSKYAPLTMDRYITGLVRQRSPLRDAAVPYNQAKYFQAGRYDSLWDGKNVELNSNSNLARRPGSSLYNNQDFPAINRFADHRIVVDGVASIRTLADTAAAVYDATGPSVKQIIWSKSAGAGKTFFQSVGNTLYFTNGVDLKKWIIPAKAWHATTLYKQGDTILDSNSNIQMAFGAATDQISSTTIADHIHGIGFPAILSDITIQLNAADAPYATGDSVRFFNLTVATVLNGQTLPVTNLGGGRIQVTIPVVPVQATTTDTGTTYSEGDESLSGTTAGTQPTWGTGFAQPTTDGSIIWINKGSSVQNWGLVGPAVAPTLAQIPLVGGPKQWAASTYYFTQQVVIDPSGAILAQLFVPGTTNVTAPTFNPALGHTTTDGTAKWITLANGTPGSTWGASVSVGIGSIVTFPVAGASYVFACVLPGVTGAAAPSFMAALGSQTNDNFAIWQNVGPLLTYGASVGPSQAVETAQTILDTAGFAQNIEISGISGTVAPAWNDASVGAITTDNAATWINNGQVAIAATGPVDYAFAGRSSVDGSVSNASPESISLLKRANRSVLVQGIAPTDPQEDIIVIYRTAIDGSTLLEVDEMPSPGPGVGFTYLDTSVDDDLNILIEAAIDEQNDPPPLGLTALTYHESRVWGMVNNVLYFSDDGDVGGNGNGNTAWSPGNTFGFPDSGIRLVPVTIQNGGLLVFTTSDIYAIFGDGTANNAFADRLYGAGIGLLNYDALDIIGATIHLQTTAKKQISLDPSAGYIETGQPIGDQFKKVTTAGFNAALFTPATTFVTWHESESGDTGLIVADGLKGFFRYSPISAPETGFLWSPFAVIEGGTSAVQSVETSPGHKQLLMGPATSGPILARDTSVNSDNGVPYSDTWAVIGSIQLCQPYEICEVAGVVLDYLEVPTGPVIGMLFGEIYKGVSGPQFTMYKRTGNDPPLLPVSETVPGDRFVMMQKGKCPKHRHIQMLIQLAIQDAPDEILTHTFFGSVSIERKAA